MPGLDHNHTIYQAPNLTAGTDCPTRSSWSTIGSPTIAVPCPRPASSAFSLFPSYSHIYLGLVLLGYEGVSEHPDFQEQTLVFIVSQFAIGFLLSAVVVGSVQFSLELGVGLPGFNDGFLHDFHFSFQLLYGLEVFLWGHIIFDSFGADHYIIERGLQLEIPLGFINQLFQIQMQGSAVVIILLLVLAAGHPVKDIGNGQKQVVEGFASQPKAIAIPFKKCFKVETDLQAHQQYIQFNPTRVQLNLLKQFSLKSQGSKISLLQQLRSPIIYKHNNLLALEGYLIVLLAPKTVLVVSQTANSFTVKSKYKIPNLERFDKYKLYKVGNKGLLVIYNKRKAYLLGENGYQGYYFKEAETIVHLEAVSGDQFYTAQFTKGLGHYKINHQTKKIELVKKVKGSSINMQGKFKYVVDVSLSFIDQGIILVLDAQIGLIQLQIKGENQYGSKVIVSHKMCESFDTIERSHVVLLCQNQGHSTIIEVYRELDRKNKEFVYRKVQPIFQANYLSDLHVTDIYFIAYSYKNIHVFWNTVKNKIPEMMETQSQIGLQDLETFTFSRNEAVSHLYTVEGGILNRYRLEEKPAELYALAQYPISKTFKLFMYGSCSDVEEQARKKDKAEACRLSRTISLEIGEQQYARKEDFSISASIIGLLVIMFLLIIWICLKKYKGLEREARKVLSNYQNKRARGTREI